MKKTNIIKAVTIAGGALTAALAYANSLFFGMAFRIDAKKRPRGGMASLGDIGREGRDWLHAHDKDIVTMTNREGMKLRAHYIPCENAKRTIIEFHGWHGKWDVDFSGSSPYLHKMGCNLLLVEQRGQGKSEGKYMTFGLKERYDVMDWVKWYQKEIDDSIPIVLTGLSMGATTVLMAAADPFPEQVKGIIADCGFHSAYDIIYKVSKQNFHLPEHPLMDLFNLQCKLRLKTDLKEWTTIDAVSQTDLPILFIHGTGDDFVPYEMTVMAYEACQSEKDLLLVEGASHGFSFIDDKDAYISKVEKFFEKLDL